MHSRRLRKPFGCEINLKGVEVDRCQPHGVRGQRETSEPEKNNIAVFSDVRPDRDDRARPPNVTRLERDADGPCRSRRTGANITDCHFEYGYDKTYGILDPLFARDPARTLRVELHADRCQAHRRRAFRRERISTTAWSRPTPPARRRWASTKPSSPRRHRRSTACSSEGVTATSAELIAQVNPNGLPTNYPFEYGPSKTYGRDDHRAHCRRRTQDQEINAQLTGLTPHTAYHFRLTTENTVEGKEEGGTTVSEDHTFNFYPPPCPNENVRQQTQANYLPDCRAYELVSPGDAGGTQLYPGRPEHGLRHRAPRASRSPGSGRSIPDPAAARSTASATSTSRPAPTPAGSRDTSACPRRPRGRRRPPQGLFGQGGPKFLGYDTSLSNGDSGADIIQNNVLTDPGMNRFLDWNDGNQERGTAANPTPDRLQRALRLERRRQLPRPLADQPRRGPDRAQSRMPSKAASTRAESHSLDCPDVIGTAGAARSNGVYDNFCPGTSAPRPT